MRTPITTTLNVELLKEAKKRGIKISYALEHGIHSLIKPQASVETVMSHTAEIERLKQLLDKQVQTIRRMRRDQIIMEEQNVQIKLQ